MPGLVAHLQKLHDQWNSQLIEPLWLMPKKTDAVFLGSIAFTDMEAEQ